MNGMKKALALAVGLALMLALVVGHVGTQAQATEKNIVEIAQEDGNFTSLVAALTATDLVDDLSGPGPFTVFAPTDDAFAKLDPAVLDDLLNNNTAALADILLYHVVSGAVMSTDLSDGMTADTLQGESLNVAISADGVMINDAMVVVADIEASNGVIHVIDTVLIPPEEPAPPVGDTIVDIAVASGDFDCLVQALTAAGLVDELSGPGPFTVFAPTDDAFAALDPCVLKNLLKCDTETLTQILLYHVAAGETMSGDLEQCMKISTLQGGKLTVQFCGDAVYINNAKVVTADIQASNGVIHVIDTVLLPPAC